MNPEIVTLNGFKYFKVGSRYCAAMVIDGKLVYASTYRGNNHDDDFKEPGDNEFIAMLKNQRGEHE